MYSRVGGEGAASISCGLGRRRFPHRGAQVPSHEPPPEEWTANARRHKRLTVPIAWDFLDAEARISVLLDHA